MRRMDVILRFAGQEVRDLEHLRVLVAAHAPREEVTVEVLRQRQIRELNIVLAPRAPAPQPGETAEEDGGKPTRLLGITVAALTGGLSERVAPAAPRGGMVVVQVEPGSMAWRKGLRPGDLIVEVNEIAVSSAEEVHEALDRSPDVVALRIFRGGEHLGHFFLSR
jgi:serine protease Do